jgi:hypothetical protein
MSAGHHDEGMITVKEIPINNIFPEIGPRQDPQTPWFPGGSQKCGEDGNDELTFVVSTHWKSVKNL